MTGTNSGIAKLDPRLDALIPANVSLDVLADFSERNGPHWLEGPVWNRREECLLFSDVKANAIHSWDRDPAATPGRSNLPGTRPARTASPSIRKAAS